MFITFLFHLFLDNIQTGLCDSEKSSLCAYFRLYLLLLYFNLCSVMPTNTSLFHAVVFILPFYTLNCVTKAGLLKCKSQSELTVFT